MTGGLVLCLGKTGRNFGAGMSGGIAYVLDEDGEFVSKRLNPEMVKVYPLVECDDAEIQEVRGLIETHVDYTASKRGREILDDWEVNLNKFLKVMPEDYERVLVAMKRPKKEDSKAMRQFKRPSKKTSPRDTNLNLI